MTSKYVKPALNLNETKVVAASRKAFKTFYASLPDKAHPALKSRTKAKTKNLFEVVVMPIDKFRYAYDKIQPVDVQRDHLRRIARGECSYLEALHLTHVQFIVVVDPLTHEIGMADGNTRSSLFFVEDSTQVIPDHVVVMVYYPPTKEMARDIYHCVDSSVNHKRTRHNISSMYRACDINVDSLGSGLVGDGHLTSAFKRLGWVHGIRGITSPNGHDKLEQLVRLYVEPLEWLDGFRLGAKTLNQGIVGSVMWLRQQRLGVDDLLNRFLNEIINGKVNGIQVGLSSTVRQLLTQLAVYGDGKEALVDYAFSKCYAAFENYLAEAALKAPAAERKRFQNAASSMSELPAVIFKKVAAVEK